MSRAGGTDYPTTIVIFGVTGDLAARKLVPALFGLYAAGNLPKELCIIGFSRRELSRSEFESYIEDMVRAAPNGKNGNGGRAAREEMLARFVKLFRYERGQFDTNEGYESLRAALAKRDGALGYCTNKLFYLAVPPLYYESLFTRLAASGLTIPCGADGGWTRVVVEKPFGSNFETAEALDRLLGTLFAEDQIYRIDHYLGKETVQNILAFRFSNSFFNFAWDNKAIERIAIRMHETIGVEGRGGFYDSIGALRDVGQNHLLQLAALFTMDQPAKFDADSVRAGRLAVLEKFARMKSAQMKEKTARGQYRGYTKEEGVGAMSRTETYFRVVSELATKRWAGVPIVLEAGKKLGDAFAEVEVVFRHIEPCLCPAQGGAHYQNVLRYRIQPDERISLAFYVKRPGADLVVEEQDFTFDYGKAYSRELFLEPYEKLLLDALTGSQTLFVSTKEILASWQFVDPIVKAWQKEAVPLRIYEPGTTPRVAADKSAK